MALQIQTHQPHVVLEERLVHTTAWHMEVVVEVEVRGHLVLPVVVQEQVQVAMSM